MERITNRHIREMFEPKIELIGCRSSSDNLRPAEFDGDRIPHTLYSDASLTSWLRIGDPGVHLLLGRNAAGKSTLLQGFEADKGRSDRLVKLCFAFRLPSEHLHGQWRELVSEISNSTWLRAEALEDHYNYEDHLCDVVRLWTHEAIIDSLFTEPWGELPRELRFDTPRGVLSHFGFSEDAITRWEHVDQHGGNVLASHRRRFYPEPPESFSVRPHAAALFLQLALRGSFPSSLDEETHIFDLIPDSAKWIHDPEHARRIGPALEQLAGTFNWALMSSQGELRLAAPRPADGPLADFLRSRRDELHPANGDKHGRVVPTFPFDLVEIIDIDGEEHVATPPVQMLSDDPSAWTAKCVDVHQQTIEQLDALTQAYVDHHLRVRVLRPLDAASEHTTRVSQMNEAEGAADTELLAISGFDGLAERFETVGNDLKSLDLGIGGLRLLRLPAWVLEGRDTAEWEYRGPRKLDLLSKMRLQWLQTETGNWLDLHEASLGQRDAILILLAVGAPGWSNNRRDVATGARFVIVDEFDQHLHPTAAASLIEVAMRRAKENGQIAILSTHSVPSLADASLRQAPRIYAQRTHDGLFRYTQGASADPVAMASILGSHILDAIRLKRLFVVVEGDHDELVLRHLLESNSSSDVLAEIEIVNARGTWAFTGIWENVLSFHDAPVLFVHDKQPQGFLEAWAAVRAQAEGKGVIGISWNESPLRPLLDEVTDRYRRKSSQTGDSELKEILTVLKSVLPNDGTKHLAPGIHPRGLGFTLRRLHFHGLPCHDIVDLLPIGMFMGAAGQQTWDHAYDRWREARRKRETDQSFKDYYRITTKSVAAALGRVDVLAVPALQDLLRRVIDLVDRTKHHRDDLA